MRYSVVLISQPGAIPWILKKITRSKWNHVGLIDESGLIRDLDWSGPGTYRIEDRPGWEFMVLPAVVFNPMVEIVHGSYRYSIWQNLNWILRKMGIRYRVYRRYQREQNCVGFIAEIFRCPSWASLSPAELEEAEKCRY